MLTIVSDDCKLVLKALGLGTAASKHCCMYCELPKNKFGDPQFMYEGGTLRSFLRIENFAQEYQEAAAAHTGATKLSSAPWFNCEQPPLCMPTSDGQKDVLVIDCLCPPVIILFSYLVLIQ